MNVKFTSLVLVLTLAGACADRPRQSGKSERLVATLGGTMSPEQLVTETVRFFQLDFLLDGGTQLDSDWGQLELTYLSSNETRYFNLEVNGSWQVRNIALLADAVAGEELTVTMDFSLLVPPGTDVTSVSYAYQISSEPLVQMSAGLAAALVEDREISINSGIQGELVTVGPAVPLIGAPIMANQAATHDKKNFPNQEAGLNECVPTAVSNSLQFLNAKHDLGMTAAQMSIATMKVATGWAPDGCNKDTWPATKAAFLKANGYPIDTKKLNNNQIMQVIKAIDDDCDVEMTVTGHAVDLVSAARQRDGNTKLEAAHDPNQRKPGTATIEEVTFNPKTRKIEGGSALLNGKDVKHWVVECPVKPKPSPSPSPSPRPSPSPSPRPSPNPSPSPSPRPSLSPSPGPTTSPLPSPAPSPSPTLSPNPAS